MDYGFHWNVVKMRCCIFGYEKKQHDTELIESWCRSKYTDEQIGLISEDDFQAKAPESLKAGAVDSHKLQCQRLIHEKQERLDLVCA